MQASPYLAFNGQCEAAFKFYEQCLGGKLVMMVTYGDLPEAYQTSPDSGSAIMHARLVVGDTLLMGGDAPPQRYVKPQGFWVSLMPNDPAEADRIFHDLSDGGTVQMPIEKTFWAERFGMVTDRFGTPWMINCEAK